MMTELRRQLALHLQDHRFLLVCKRCDRTRERRLGSQVCPSYRQVCKLVDPEMLMVSALLVHHKLAIDHRLLDPQMQIDQHPLDQQM